MTMRRWIVGITSWIVLSAVVASSTSVRAQDNPFDRYLQQPDPTYRWELVRSVKGNPGTLHVIKLVSQSWRTPQDVDRTQWEHWLLIVTPEKITSNKALIMVSGGSNGGEPPSSADAKVVQIAEATQSVVAELKMIPNQPLVFHNDGVPRKEDDLIAYAWIQYLDTGDPTWLPRFPMVKAVLRAMDTIQEFVRSEQGGGKTIEKFVIAGGSKRGWTTWMAGASGDPRVAAIVPIVIDVVNVNRTMRNHAAVYGFWAEAIGDYVQHGVMRRWNDPKLLDLYRLVDPYFYRDRLTMPKLVLNAAGDQFFTPDSSQFYYDDLKGPKLLRYVPNGDHSLRDTNALESLIAFYQCILSDKPLPEYHWTFEPGGSIRVVTEHPVRQVLLWQATNPEARDFRLQTIGRAFRSQPLEPGPDGAYVARVRPPEKGWTAYFVEITFENETRVPLTVSTAVRIVPDVLPYADVDPTTVPYERQQP